MRYTEPTVFTAQKLWNRILMYTLLLPKETKKKKRFSDEIVEDLGQSTIKNIERF